MDIRAYNMTFLSEIAYLEEEQIKYELMTKDFTFVKWFSFGALQAYLCECEDGQALVFRGSQNMLKHPEDWGVNLDSEIIDTYIGRCQKGYFEELVREHEGVCARDEMIKYILDKNVFITGHSAGGAYAIIFEIMLRYKSIYKPLCVVAEPPKVTDDANFNPHCYFTVNNADGVCRYPFTAVYTGTMLFFTLFGGFRKNPKFYERLAQFLIDVDDIFKDHRVEDLHLLWKKHWKKIDKIIFK